jgi:RNA recognition motif-containing protein
MGPPLNMRNGNMASDDEDLIPTAIVIKNIPFAVKKEQLVQIMTEMNLPLPYAFNYHFDNGVFRGLAFANFTTPDETHAVIGQMNHLDLHGRKLRVEYKREKRERRGQLEEQHRPMPVSQLQSRQSMSSLSTAMRATSPIPSSLIDPITGRRKCRQPYSFTLSVCSHWLQLST